jgi:hypothetical protein
MAGLEPSAGLRTNPDGAGIVQTVGPLKGLRWYCDGCSHGIAKIPVVTELSDPSRVFLQHSRPSTGD